MYNTLDALWSEYLLESCGTLDSEKEKALASAISCREDKLRATLSAAQKEDLEVVMSDFSELNALFAQKAFASGIRFATCYLWEALHDK